MTGPIDTTTLRRDLRWRVGMWVNGLLAGDHEWGQRRVMLLALLVAAFTLMGRAVDPPDLSAVCIPQALVTLLSGPPPVDAPPTGATFCLIDIQNSLPAPIGGLVVFVISLGLPHTLRHLLPPLIAMYVARRIGANYVRDLLELPDAQTANDFLGPALEGVGYREVTVRAEGPTPDEQLSPLIKIGGPGYIRVTAGNAVVLERYGRPSDAFGQGTHFIHHFEQLRDVVDLRDQYRRVETFEARTKDGLKVTVHNLEVAFRLLMRTRQRTESDQYPFLRSAARLVAYDRLVRRDPAGLPRAEQWTEAVTRLVVERVQQYINNCYLDDLIHSKAHDPREHIKLTIKQLLEGNESRAQLAKRGVDLLWVSLGHIGLPEAALNQRITTWQSRWQVDAERTLAQSEADRLRRMEYARTLTRLEIIQKMTEAAERGEPISANMVLIHFARAIEDVMRHASPTGLAAPTNRSLLRMLRDLAEVEPLPARDISQMPSAAPNSDTTTLDNDLPQEGGA